MKIICTTKPLIDAVATASRVAKVRTPRVAMQCVRIVAAKGGPAMFQAHSGDLWVSSSVAAVDVLRAGEAIVNAERLSRALSHYADYSTVTLEVEDDKLKVRGDRVVVTLWCVPSADFPPPMDLDSPVDSVTLPAAEMANQLRRASLTMGGGVSAYCYPGVLFRRQAKSLDFAATDGRRLNLTTISKAGGKSAMCIVPEAAVKLILGQLGAAEEGEAVVTLTKDRVGVFAGEVEIRTVLIEGRFPPIEDNIPAVGLPSFECKSDELLGACRAVSVTTCEEKKGIRLSRTSDGFSITSTAPEVGSTEFSVDATFTGDVPPAMACNPMFIIDAIEAAATAAVSVSVEKEGKPFVIRTGDGLTAVFMPVALDRS